MALRSLSRDDPDPSSSSVGLAFKSASPATGFKSLDDLLELPLSLMSVTIWGHQGGKKELDLNHSHCTISWNPIRLTGHRLL
jgi:hypothetical protein